MSPVQSPEPVPSSTYAYRVPAPEQGAPPEPPRKRRWLRALIVLVLVALTAIIAWRTWTSRKEAAAQATRKQAAMMNRAVPVQVKAVQLKTMPIYLTGLGTVTPYYSVRVTPRVTGELIRVNFREGQDVKKGQELMLIDPRPYQATLDQARGQLARDQAQLQNNQAEFNRYKALYDQGVVSREQLDTFQSNLGQFLGAIKADQAAIEADALNVTYCHVTSPIDGRVGLRLVDPGNLVIANSTQTLVINQFKPIAVYFTLPEDQLQRVLAKLRQNKQLLAEAFDRSDITHLEDGNLMAVDNQIDPTTGTDKLKAVFTNNEDLLFPNQFVNIHLILEQRPNAIVVPAAALQRGNEGDFVWVVKPDKTVIMQPVKGSTVEGTTVVLDSGVTPGQLIVTDGADKLRDGTKVDPRMGPPGGQRSGQQQPGQPQPVQQQTGQPSTGQQLSGQQQSGQQQTGQQPRGQRHARPGGPPS
jgi:multidrug efflux system membrane fusion protein